MSVYVDDMRANFGRMIMCHMIADDAAALHAMAARIGVARRWFQGDHYDIALSKRAEAVRFGAIEITQRQAAAMVYLAKHAGTMPPPDEAEEKLRAWHRARREATAEPPPSRSNHGRSGTVDLEYFLDDPVTQRGRVDRSAGRDYPPDYDDLPKKLQHKYEFGRLYQAAGAPGHAIIPDWNSMFPDEEFQ